MFVLLSLGWSNLKEILLNGSGFGGIILTAALFLLVMAIFAIVVLLFNSWKTLAPAAGLILLAYLLVFGYHWAHLAVFAAGLSLILAGVAEVKREKAVHIKVLPAQITKPASGALFTVLALAVSVVIYFSPPAQGLKAEIKIPRPLFDVVLNSMTGFIENQAKDFLRGQSDLLISGMSRVSGQQLSQIEGAGELDLDQILTPKDRDSLYQMISQQINFFIQPYKKFLPYGLAVAVFFSLKTIGFIFVWLAGLMTSLIFAVLKALGAVNIGKEMVEREKIEILNYKS